MREVYDKIEEVKKKIEDVKDDKYEAIFNSFSYILQALSSKVEDVIAKQEYLEENMEYIGDDLTDIREEFFEEVSYDELTALDDSYVEIKCKECNKPLFIEQEALNNNESIPCPFCGGKAK